MWEWVYITTAEAPAECLWKAARGACAWPTRGAKVGNVRPPSDGRAGAGQVGLQVEECEAPHRFAFSTWLPLACWRARFEFDPSDRGTRVRITVQLAGLLAFFWRRVLREARAEWLSELADQLVREARELGPGLPGPNPVTDPSARLAAATSYRGVP